MFKRLSSLFGRIITRILSEQRNENTELWRWARYEYPYDAEYAYNLMVNKKMKQLKETYR